MADPVRYSVLLAREAEISLREIDIVDQEVIADALVTLLDSTPGAGTVFPLTAGLSSYLSDRRDRQYLVLVTETLHVVIFRPFTAEEWERQGVLVGGHLEDRGYLVIDLVPLRAR